MSKLKDKVIVITGATGVLCRAIALNLAENGATVVCLARKKEAGDALVKEITDKGGKAYFFTTDVTDIEKLKKNREEILATCGTIDVLINGAGGNMPGANVLPDQSLLDLDLDELRKAIDLNLYGTIYPTQIFSEVMIRNKKGNIINFTSVTVDRPMTRVIGYSSAKAAIANFTKWLAVEFAQKYGDQMRVNAIRPGFYLTEQNRSLLTNPDGSLTERGGKIINMTPMGRMGRPEELCGAVLYLCSDDSSFMNGQTITVDGGFETYSGV
ncbi:MAG: SDR family oxidoreductase [Bacteroidota bacterium]|nr:SDR family oxidoreductase [Bacteroidota bacterium]